MKYSTASIDATNGTDTVNINLDGMTSQSDLAQCLWSTWKHDQGEDADTDEMPEHVTLSNPKGFAVHLFSTSHPSEPGGGVDYSPVANFDDILEVWSNESDDDRREAMGEYLEDMGASDLSDFDEAYQGEHGNGATFAETLCEELGTIPNNFPDWIAIDWDRTWERSLRHDYHITANGHVFRHL